MNNKSMSEQLIKNQNNYKKQSKWKTEQQLKKLQRLEKVLEILKQNIVSKDGTTTTFDTRDERIKEWLEND